MREIQISRILAVALLCAMGAYRIHSMHAPADVTAYHAAIRESVKDVPHRIDAWVGRDVEPSVQATMLLHPNLMISRQYLDLESGRSVGFLLVHCTDAHDMAGHFPLRCYPAQDWKVVSATPKDWNTASLAITGMEYEFSKSAEIGGHGDSHLIVANFLLRPGHILRDMDAMVALIRGAGGQAQGAAQVQVCFDASVPPDARDKIVKTFITAYEPVIRAILADPSQVKDPRQVKDLSQVK
jgi:hypothetical protein